MNIDDEEQLNQILNKVLLSTHKVIDWEEVRSLLVPILNEIASTDFHQLMSILYRIDVSEIKVRKALHEDQTKTEIGIILAELIIERQKQKIELRNRFSSK